MNHITNLYQSFRHEALPFGRAHAKKYVRQFLLLFLIGIAASWLASSFVPGKDANGVEIINFMSFLSDILWVLVSAILTVISLQIYLDVNASKSVNFNYFKLDTRAKRRTIGKWIWGYILYVLIVMWWVWVFTIPWIWGYWVVRVIGVLGVLIFIILWIYFGIRLSFWEFFLVDQKSTIKESLRASWDKTKWHERQLLWVWFLSLGVMILWALALWIGLLRAIPTIKIAYTHLYKKLAG